MNTLTWPDLLALGGPLLFLHAHPDDETIATGALIAALRRAGVAVDVCTATRGERGELVPGSVTDGTDLPAHRRAELAAALSELGVQRHCFLGQPPARAAGEPPVAYPDSGMDWMPDGVAGPALDVSPDAFSSVDLAAPAADFVALVQAWAPAAVVGYDAFGTYGHPDHRRAHEVSRLAAARTGKPFVEIASHPDPARSIDVRTELPTLRRALEQHRSQLTVLADGIEHVGGQRDPFTLTVELRRDW